MQGMAITPAADPKVRRSGIGSSDAPIIAGISPYATPADLFLEKRGLAERDVPEFVREAARWGQIMEPVILREFAQREGIHVLGRDDRGSVIIWTPDGTPRETFGVEDGAGRFYPPGPSGASRTIPATAYQAILGTARHPDREWMMWHPDGFGLTTDMDPALIIEAKTGSEWVSKEWGQEDSDEVPPTHLVQTQHGAEVARGIFGKPLPIRIPVVLGGNRFRIFRLAHDAALVEDLLRLEAEFWKAVQDGDMPEIEPNALGLETLKRLYPEDDGSERLVPASHPLHETAVQLARVSAELKAAEERKAALNVAIQKEMGETRKLIGDGWSYTWTEVRGRVKDSDVIAELAERAGVDAAELEQIQERHRGTPSRQPYPYLRKL